MAKTFEEMQGFLRARTAASSDLVIHQQRAKAEVGRIMSELISDPRWALYAQHMEALRAREQDKSERLENDLLNDMTMDHSVYAIKRIEFHGVRKYIEALDLAINLAVNLIKEGEQALTVSEKQA